MSFTRSKNNLDAPLMDDLRFGGTFIMVVVILVVALGGGLVVMVWWGCGRQVIRLSIAAKEEAR